MKKVIAIVDDDIFIGDMLEKLLKSEGYETLRAYSGSEVLLLACHKKIDLILLDLMLPGISGEEVLAKIKNIPTIIVSAKIDIDNKIQLLLDGAVDYIVKPFDSRELLARIVVALRNNRPKEKVLKYMNLQLDLSQLNVLVCEKEVKLTKTEFYILKALVQNKDRVLSKNEIMYLLEEVTPDIEESSLKTHIANLRSKLKKVDGVDYIEAVWGIGYKIKS